MCRAGRADAVELSRRIDVCGQRPAFRPGVHLGYASSRVLARDRVPANQEHVGNHAGSVEQRIDARSGIVSPTDGDFHHAEAELIGEEKNFRIESPAFYTLQGEHSSGSVAAKGFEPALGILEIESQQQPEQQDENSPEELAGEGLPTGLQRAASPTRSDCDIRAGGERLQQLGGFLDGRGHICIGEQYEFPGGLEHSMANAVTFAPVSGVLQQADDARIPLITAHDFRRPIVRAIIDHDDFGVPAVVAGESQNPIQSRAQALFFVKGRDNDAERRSSQEGTILW